MKSPEIRKKNTEIILKQIFGLLARNALWGIELSDMNSSIKKQMANNY